jgi:hypothetical protein
VRVLGFHTLECAAYLSPPASRITSVSPACVRTELPDFRLRSVRPDRPRGSRLRTHRSIRDNTRMRQPSPLLPIAPVRARFRKSSPAKPRYVPCTGRRAGGQWQLTNIKALFDRRAGRPLPARDRPSEKQLSQAVLFDLQHRNCCSGLIVYGEAIVRFYLFSAQQNLASDKPMTLVRRGFCGLAIVICGSCTSSHGTVPRIMGTCVEGASPTSVAISAFSTALGRAQAYSDQIYGKDCFVCAEVFADEPTSYTLHITSPIQDMLINTSATIRFRKSDGAVVATARYHSCHARIEPRVGSK